METPRGGREDRLIADPAPSDAPAQARARPHRAAGDRSSSAGAPPWPGWGWDGEGRRHPRRHGPPALVVRLLRGGPPPRSVDNRLIAGVAGGVAERVGVDVTVVRIVFVLLGLASGVGVALYVLAWFLLPVQGRAGTIAGRAVSDGRGLALALAFLPALVLGLLVASALRIGFVSSMGWPLFLSVAGLVLIWRNADDDERVWLRRAAEPLLRLGSGTRRSRRSLALRVAGGVILVGAGLSVLVLGHADRTFGGAVGGALLVLAGFVILFGPWWLSLARDLVAERQARVRAEERADMAARVHDSVLQTLALIQRSSTDPQRVVQLARTQERELRSWLFEGRRPGSFEEAAATTLAEGVQAIERDVESAHGVAVEAVTVGDCSLTDDLRELLAAAREATVNAAKWSGAPVVSVFAEVEPEKATIFVRDRGKGFDPAVVSSDRRGIAESIRGRMARHGGTATVASTTGAGTEVELGMPRRGDRGGSAG